MKQWPVQQYPVADRVREELRSLRSRVPGVHGTLVATSDGMLVTHDIPDVDPARLAALVSTTLGLARQTVRETGRGEFREALARGTTGYLMVYAAGNSAVVAVLGDDRAQPGLLQYEARRTVAMITEWSGEFAGWATARRPAPPATPPATPPTTPPATPSATPPAAPPAAPPAPGEQ